MDMIFVERLEVLTIIGVYDWERHAQQKVIIDLEISTDTKAAGLTDNLERTIDYGTLCTRITELAAQSSYQLLEALGENIAALCLEDQRAKSVSVKLCKPTAVSNAGGVGVKITRHRS